MCKMHSCKRQRDANLSAACQVKIEGIVRKSENPSTFVPKNNPEKGQWFWIDVPEIAAACGLAPDTPLVEVQNMAAEWFKRLSAEYSASSLVERSMFKHHLGKV